MNEAPLPLLNLSHVIDGFHVTSSPPCWWTKTKDLSLASSVLPPGVVRFSIVIGVSRDWLKTSYRVSFGLILSPHAAHVAINLYKTNFNKVHLILITIVGKSTRLSCL